jgi:hypothetical protein
LVFFFENGKKKKKKKKKGKRVAKNRESFFLGQKLRKNERQKFKFEKKVFDRQYPHSFIINNNYFFGAMSDILPAAVAAAIDSVHDPASESLWAVFGRSEAGEMAVLASGEGDAGWREALPADAVQCGFFFVFCFFVWVSFF